VRSPDVLMVGHLARDRIVVDGRAEVATGGGVYYGSVALRRLGVSVAVATRLHPDDYHRLYELRREGVSVHATAAPETSGIENVYDSRDMERRTTRPLGFAGPFRREDIPGVRPRVIIVASIIAGEVDVDVLLWLAERAPVALDVQGFVRWREGDGLVFRDWPDMARGLRHVTFLKVDLAEAELLTGCSSADDAVRHLAGMGPSEVVLTQSSGVTVFAGGCLHRAPFTSCSLVGRTGRGDTCFAAYVGRRLSAPPADATRLAAAVTTLKQERPGPWRGTLEDALALAERQARSGDESTGASEHAP